MKFFSKHMPKSIVSNKLDASGKREFSAQVIEYSKWRKITPQQAHDELVVLEKAIDQLL